MRGDVIRVLPEAQNSRGEHFVFVASIVIVTIILFIAAASAADSYDGKWWLSVPEMQRKGFVHGFSLCYVHLLRCAIVSQSYEAYDSRLAEYLKTHPEELSTPLNLLLPKLAMPPYARPGHSAGAGNETPAELREKWGAHEDGDDWRGGGPWNLGYIQGFLECYSKDTSHQYGTFSKSAAWYVSEISDWYGTKEGDPGVINPAREKEKIPEVLFRFHDKSRTSKSKKS